MQMNRCRILHITDDDADHRLVRELFGGKGAFTVEHAAGSDAALLLLRERAPHERPNLIIMPWSPSGGPELIQILKDDSMLRTIPVVVLTTGAVSDDYDYIWSLGAAAVVEVPPNVDAAMSAFAALRRFWTEVVHLPNCDTLPARAS